ncbi:hypothetical protein DV451_001571 [Geotrichum candidum]|uniref:Polyadenylate-binding protein n=1 Tax=Geotrichum candidum TaxID=1173061 RepID=A0A0J9XBX2_GEOCN|nr:hypothetical protein DV451_001571 [Geotrichum candidum]KAI9214257.1 hypothetical protein DS838_000899 [Geotrichum bryndzae]KAF5106178.1 hypothetical protein DV453_004154 [Geotrichum candidum]KAF5114477.1 hypothetical protein DV452_003285 [Geotrichum candidum]KAF5115310.1 hypothetical protein DV454_002346 [Geotrichum candidum]
MSADASVSAAEKALEELSLNKTEETTETSAAPAAETTESAESAAASGESSTEIASNASLYVGELDPSVSEAMLFEIFNQIGPVASIRVCRDVLTKRSLGYAYINYHNIADGERALAELNYTPIKGRPCRIMWSQRDPSLRRTGAGNIFIKNLDPAIDNKDLHDTFSTFGKILSCKIATDDFGVSKGYGFVHFETPAAAESAIKNVNGMLLNDRKVYVGIHIAKQDRQSKSEEFNSTYTNVYVKNVDASITDEEFEELFKKYGVITSATLAKDAEGASRGFGFVNFESHDAATAAVEALDGSELKGKKLYVGRAQKKYEREEELKKQHEAARIEKSNKYVGVNLYIKNLDDTIDDEKLREVFAPHGTITSAKVMTDDHGKSKGFGFVCFSTPEEATKAVAEMNQYMLAGKPLYVALAQRKDVRRNQLMQQIQAKNQIRLQQQAAAAGIPGQYLPNPMFYGPGQQPGFIQPVHGRPYPGGNPQVMMHPPRQQVIPPPQGQWAPRGAAGQPIIPGYNMGPVYNNFPGGVQGGRPQGRPYNNGFPGGNRGGRRGPNGPNGGQPGREEPPLSVVVNNAPEEARKQIVGEYIFPKVLENPNVQDPALASKITGMLLDMNINELVALTDDDASFNASVDAAVVAYNEYLESKGGEGAAASATEEAAAAPSTEA